MTSPSDAALPPPSARLLLVEDDDELRALMATSLVAAGFEVIEACDGEGFIDRLVDALNATESGRVFDVILSDIQMPAFSALDVLVGAHRLIGQTPVILLTAFGDAQTHEKARLRGAALVLDKPIRMTVLCETVSRLLIQAQGSGPNEPSAI